MRVLIAYDGSAPADAAVDEVIARPWPAGSEIRLVTVIETAPTMHPAEPEVIYQPLLERVRCSVRDEAYHRLKRALAKFKDRPDLSVTCEIREGAAKPALLDAIREWGADLVLAGSSGTASLTRFFLGSVCQALVTHAPCSVEIVRSRSAR